MEEALLPPFLDSTIMFSVIYDDYEKNLLSELWSCHKYMNLSMTEIYDMPTYRRKFFIAEHNRLTEKEAEQFKARTRKK